MFNCHYWQFRMKETCHPYFSRPSTSSWPSKAFEPKTKINANILELINRRKCAAAIGRHLLIANNNETFHSNIFARATHAEASDANECFKSKSRRTLKVLQSQNLLSKWKKKWNLVRTLTIGKNVSRSRGKTNYH